MNTELATRLDRSIGPAPDDDPPWADLLEQGHRAVRRRRLGVTVASAAAVLVVAGGFALITGGGPDQADAPVDEPTQTASTTPSSLDKQRDEALDGPLDEAVAPAADESAPTPAETRSAASPMLAEFDSGDPTSDRELHLRDGVEVLRQVDNPWPVLEPPAVAAGLAARFQGRTWWLVTYLAKNGSSGSTVTWAGDTEGLGFEDWVRAQAGRMLSGRGTDDESTLGIPAYGLVRFAGATEQLTVANGGEILEQRPGVDVGESFAGPDDRTAAALVRAPTGEVVYVLVRALPHESSQPIAVPVDQGGADLDAFLEMARARYAEGGGGLL